MTPNYQYTPWLDVYHNAFTKLQVAAVGAWIILVCTQGYGGQISEMLMSLQQFLCSFSFMGTCYKWEIQNKWWETKNQWEQQNQRWETYDLRWGLQNLRLETLHLRWKCRTCGGGVKAQAAFPNNLPSSCSRLLGGSRGGTNKPLLRSFDYFPIFLDSLHDFL